MVKKTEVCAFEFVCPQVVSLSSGSSAVTMLAQNCLCILLLLRQAWWELEDSEYLLAYEANKLLAAVRDLALTPKLALLIC